MTVGLVACGSDEIGQGVVRTGASSAEALAGITVSTVFTAVLVPLGGSDAAVVDGAAAAGGGGHRLVATWAVDGRKQEAVSEGLPPIVFPKAWWDEPTLYVFGQECPQVDLELVDDISEFPLEQVCGKGSRYALRSLDTGTGRWSVVTDAIPTGLDGKAFVIAAAGDEALLEVESGEVRVLSARSGRGSVLTPVSLEGATLDLTCPLAGGGFLVVSTTAEPPGPSTRETVAPDIWLIRDGEVSPTSAPTDGAPPGVVDHLGASRRSRHAISPAGRREWVQAAEAFPSLDPPDDALLIGDEILAFVERYYEDRPTTTTVTML